MWTYVLRRHNSTHEKEYWNLFWKKKKPHQWFLLRNTALIYPFSEQMGNSGPGKGWVQSHTETQWQCHNRMPGIINSPSLSPNKTNCLLVFRRGGPRIDLWRWAFKWVFPVARVCPQGLLYLPHAFYGGLSGSFGPITCLHHEGEGFRARRSTTAVMDPYPGFLPAVPVLVQILVVTEWYLDEMWEDFLALLSLT